MSEHPIVLVDNDDLKRSRLTVLFRYLLMIPHLIWYHIWGFAVAIVVLPTWLLTLLMGKTPKPLHNFLAGYLRYVTHVSAYANLLANPFPPFSSSDSYPVTLEIPEPTKQSRLITLFRMVLAIPALILTYLLLGLQQPLTFCCWFICLILGRMP